MLSKRRERQSQFFWLFWKNNKNSNSPKKGTETTSSLKQWWLSSWSLLGIVASTLFCNPRCSASKADVSAVCGPPRDDSTSGVYPADGSHMSARPAAVRRSPWPGTLSWQARKYSERKVLWIVPDKWIKPCEQTISLFTYQESTGLLIRCFCFHLCCSSLFLLCSVFSSHAWAKSLGILSSCDHERLYRVKMIS